jgi:hypothetical protein
MTSEGVATPGIRRIPRSWHQRPSSGSQPGETRNSAPAATACSACSEERMVPAPMRRSGWARRRYRITAAAAVVRKVTSRIRIPASCKASARMRASASLSRVATGITRTWAMAFRIPPDRSVTASPFIGGPPGTSGDDGSGLP